MSLDVYDSHFHLRHVYVLQSVSVRIPCVMLYFDSCDSTLPCYQQSNF